MVMPPGRSPKADKNPFYGVTPGRGLEAIRFSKTRGYNMQYGPETKLPRFCFRRA
jgi:hypothetical protein